jgi:hypothetical protein
MESKKINQLATELAPDLTDLTIIGDPTTGISKKITLSQMASLFTGTVEEYANFAAFPLVGVADTIYVAKDTNVIYRWDSTAYVVLSPNIIASLVFNDANGFDGTIALVGSTATLTITTALTTGSVGFIGASGALLQDNANFFWNNTNKRLGIGTNTPGTKLDVHGTGTIVQLNGTTTNNSFISFQNAGVSKWTIGNVQADHRFRIYSEANSAELVSVLQTGEFGIGIANPTTKFHIDGGASALIANLDADVSIAKSLSFRSDNSNRINLEVSGTESGSNAGANFFIRRYSDAGSLIDTPLTITRSTGLITLATALSGTSATFSGNVIAGNILQNQFHYFTSSTGTGTQEIAVIGSNALKNGGYLKIITDSVTGGSRGIRLGLNGNGTAPGSGVDVLTITDSAFVGIGITNPLAILHVKVNTNNNIGFYPKTVNSIGMQSIETTNDAGSSNTPLAINASDMYLMTQNNVVIRLTSGGSVGINTTNPQAKLHVANGNMIIGQDGTYALISGPTTGGAIQIGSNSSTFDRNLNLGLVTAGLSFSPVITISGQTGRVGINTTTPTNLLDIRGIIGTTYQSNVSVPNNNTNVLVLNAFNGGDFTTWITNVFGASGYNGLLSIFWDTGGSAGSCTFSINRHAGYNGVGIVRVSASIYNGDCYTDGQYIYFRNNGTGAYNPIFQFVMLNRN